MWSPFGLRQETCPVGGTLLPPLWFTIANISAALVIFQAPPPLGCAAVVVAAGMVAWPCNASQGSTPGASNPGDSQAIDEWL